MAAVERALDDADEIAALQGPLLVEETVLVQRLAVLVREQRARSAHAWPMSVCPVAVGEYTTVLLSKSGIDKTDNRPLSGHKLIAPWMLSANMLARTLMDVDEHEDAELRRLERGAAVDDAGAPLFEAAALLDGIRRIDAADPAGSLVTCVKELFDNALDACAAHATGRIVVRVEPLVADGSLFNVKVTDDGCGFESGVLYAIATELFATSSSNGLGGASAGACGGGLKAVMQWAQASSQGRCIEIKTTTRAAADFSVLRVKFDVGGTHESVSPSRAGGSSFAMLHTSLEQTSEPKPRESSFSGTIMNFTLGGGPAAFERLATYFTCCSAYLSPTALTISVRLPDASRMQLRDGRCEWWTHTLHVPAISLDGIYVAEALSGASP
eukprot:jgi/Chrpa1/22872/Chrysochromulina_OHIO_Genome00023076-RA